LVYASNLDTGEAVHTAFEATASEQRILSDAAAILRRNIEHAHNNLGATPWPPSASYLQHEAKPPRYLVEFLTLLTAGKPCEQLTEKTQRLWTNRYKTHSYCMDYLTFSVVLCSFNVCLFDCRLSLLLLLFFIFIYV